MKEYRPRLNEEEYEILKGIRELCEEQQMSIHDVKHGWAKTDKASLFFKNPSYSEPDNALDAFKTAIDALKEDIEPVQPKEYANKEYNHALCNQYTLTDFHLGMMAWGEETGDNWDMDIAERTLINFFKQSIEQSPMAAQAIFAQIGDLMHWDGLDAVTPANKHLLDADTRFTKVVRVAIRVIRKVIEMLLEKYPSVHLIMAEGNHDPASSIWLRETLSAFYDNEPRLTIETSPDPYYCYTWGKCCLFYHHGHKRNLKNIDTVFVSKFKEQYGKSKHVYAHLGHLHHLVMNETNLMILEQHRTLAAKDAYASRGGYMSGRDSKVITYHKEYGEVKRSTISINMIEEMEEATIDFTDI
jgi:hypothetical protein